MSQKGEVVYQFLGLSSYAEQMLVHGHAIVKIRKDMPLDRAALIGCGVTTGIGPVAFTMKVEAGATVAVFGLGGIGLQLIQGARMVGAARLIGVDVNPAPASLGQRFGWADFVKPHRVYEVGVHSVALTGGVAD